jgi:tetratricopeptide (TPR) repeat protein
VTLRLGQFLSFPGHYERAEKVFLDGCSRLKAHPSTPPEWTATLAGELAGLYRSWNKLEEAAEWDEKQKVAAEAALARSKRIVQNSGEDASLMLSHAVLLIQSDRQEAEAACQLASALDPRPKGEFHHLLGDAYGRRRDWANAERHYAQALAKWRVMGS